MALLPEVDSTPRAKALATLAFAQRTLADKSRIQPLADEPLLWPVAAVTPRRAAHAISLRSWHCAVILRPWTADSYSDTNTLRLPASTGRADLLAEAYHWQALNYFESGQLAELEALLQHYDSLEHRPFRAASVSGGRSPCNPGAAAWRVAPISERRIEELLEIGTRTRREDADGVYGAQMFALNRDLGRVHALRHRSRSSPASASQAHVGAGSDAHLR